MSSPFFSAITAPRADISKNAPRILTMTVKQDKIRDVIGSGGKVIRGIIETTDTLLKINETAAKGNSSTSLSSTSIGKCAPRLMSIGFLMEANIETRQLNQLKQQAFIYRTNFLKRICRRSASQFRALSTRSERTKNKEKLTSQKKNQDNCNLAAPTAPAIMAMFTIGSSRQNGAPC